MRSIRVALRKAAAIVILLPILASCSPQNRFIGTWYGPTDRSHFVIDASTIRATNADATQSYSAKYNLETPRKLIAVNNNGQVIMICEISDDGNSFEAEGQAPYGTGTYIMERVK